MSWNTGGGEHFIASNPAWTNPPTGMVWMAQDPQFGGAVAGDWGPATRLALAKAGNVFIGSGSFVISSADVNNNALTVATAAQRLFGAGSDLTILRITGNNLTWGIALTGQIQEVADMTVTCQSSTAAPFWLIGLPGVPGRSAQSARFTRVFGNIAAGVTVPVPPAGPPNDGVHSAVGAAIFALGPDYPGTSNFDAGNAHFRECKAQNFAGSGQVCSAYLIGNGTSGNVVGITADDCQGITCTYTVQLAGGGIRWTAGGSTGVYDTDIYVQHPGGDPAVFNGFRGENGTRMVLSPDIGPLAGGLTLVDCEFDLYTPVVAGQVIKWNAAGCLTIIGGRMSTVAGNTNFGLCTNGGSLTSILTQGLSVDVNPYPAPNLARYKRTVLNPMVDVGGYPTPGAEIHDLAVGSYNGIDTAGLGHPAIYRVGAYVGLTAAQASAVTITSPNDGAKHLYRVGGIVNVTVHGTESINLQVTYTDDGGTARTGTITLTPISGTDATAANALGPWVGHQLISVNPNTAITILTAGTFTGGATYNLAPIIEQLS